jgi:hypothetical protein
MGEGLAHWESPCGVQSPNGKSLATWKPLFSACTTHYAQRCGSSLAVNEKRPTPISTISHF